MSRTKTSPTMRVMDMTQGNPIKLILAFAVPLFIGNIFQQIYSMVDTAVAVLGLGVAGAALATVIAEGVSALLCSIYVFRHYSAYLPGKQDFRVSGSLIAELFSNGIAMALMYCVVDMGSVIFQRANNHLGETIISAHTASRRIIGIMMQPLATISTASSTFVGQNWGARKPERIRTALRQVTVMELA